MEPKINKFYDDIDAGNEFTEEILQLVPNAAIKNPSSDPVPSSSGPTPSSSRTHTSVPKTSKPNGRFSKTKGEKFLENFKSPPNQQKVGFL